MNIRINAKAVCVLICIIAGFSVAGVYSGGNGKVATPYKLSTPNDIMELASLEGDWGAAFILTNDIDMKGIAFTPISENLQNCFSGSIDGSGHAISNVEIKGEMGRYVGFFRATGSSVKISNLELRDILINVFVPDYVDKDNYIYVGGFSGNSEGKFTNCSVSGYIKASAKELASVGGICGRTMGSVFDGCASGVVLRAISSKQTFAGGLVGYSYTTTMLNNITTANVYAAGGKQTYAGGISGYALHTGFNSCSADAGSILTDNGGFSGGLAGYNYFGQVINCYALNGVFAFSKGYAGGLVGGNFYGMIRNCYFSGTMSVKSKKSRPGTIVGLNEASQILNCYWNYDASFVDKPIADGMFIGNITMLTESQIKAGGIFTDTKWNADSLHPDKPFWILYEDRLPELTRNAVIEKKQ